MSGDAADEVDYRILGPVEVWTGGRRVALGGARASTLLGLLLTEPDRVFGLDRLIEALWDAEPPGTARQQVHTTVARLRRALRAAGIGDVVHTDGPGYRVGVLPGQVDAGRFNQLVRDAATAIGGGHLTEAVELLERALDQWRGPALSGASTPVLSAIAAGLDEQRLDAVERLAELRLTTGAGDDDLVADLRTWTARHPLRERLREHLILALYRSGRRADALDEFDRVRRLLADELGLDPGPGLTSLHSRILGDDSTLLKQSPPRPERPVEGDHGQDGNGAASSPSMLPAPMSDFTGRSAELALLLATMPDDGEAAEVVTIDGMAGVGKTAMAVHTAYVLAERHPDAQLFVDLHGHTPGREPIEAAEALDVLLRHLDVPPDQIPDGLEARAARWRAELAGRRSLVVLDNAADSAQVRPLLPGSAGSVVIVTSRRRLSGIDTATPLSLDVLAADAGGDLFVAVAGTRTSDAAEVAAVVDLCGNLPLAIRLAAAKLRHRPAWTVAHLISRLRDERHRLDRLAAEDRSVTAAFAVSYDHLPAEHQRMFRLLGLHPGTDIDAYAAAALAGLDVERAETLLEDLLDHNLLLQVAPGRYTFHDLLRHHARVVAVRDEPETERDAAVQRLLDYYLACADNAATLISAAGRRPTFTVDHLCALPPLRTHADAIAWLAAEDANLVAATEHAGGRLPLHAVRFVSVLGYYILNWCRSAAWETAARTAVSSARALSDRAMEVDLLNTLSCMREELGDLDDAQRLGRAALTLAVDTDDDAGQATALINLATFVGSVGRLDEAISHLRRAATLLHIVGDTHEETKALINLSTAVGSTGAVQEEIDILERARRIAEENGHESLMIGILINAGVSLLDLGRFDEAEASLRSALTKARDHGDRRVMAAALNNLGRVLQATGRHAAAIEYINEALTVARLNGAPEYEARVLSRLADAERSSGVTQDALRHARGALAICRARGYRLEEARALDVLATTLRDTGDQHGAREHWHEALAIYDDAGTPEAARIRVELDVIGAYEH